MLPFSSASSQEYQCLKRVLRKILTCILIGCLILAKLSNISAVHHHYRILVKIASFIVYLSLAGIAFLIPMYYSAGAVRGYNVFLVCTCGSLIVEAAEFFLFLGVFGTGTWVWVELGNLCVLLLVLTLIEGLFEDRQERSEESIALTETNNSRNLDDLESQIGFDGLTDSERDQENLAIWRHFRQVMWRTRSL